MGLADLDFLLRTVPLSPAKLHGGGGDTYSLERGQLLVEQDLPYQGGIEIITSMYYRAESSNVVFCLCAVANGVSTLDSAG